MLGNWPSDCESIHGGIVMPDGWTMMMTGWPNDTKQKIICRRKRGDCCTLPSIVVLHCAVQHTSPLSWSPFILALLTVKCKICLHCVWPYKSSGMYENAFLTETCSETEKHVHPSNGWFLRVGLLLCVSGRCVAGLTFGSFVLMKGAKGSQTLTRSWALSLKWFPHESSSESHLLPHCQIMYLSFLILLGRMHGKEAWVEASD